MEFYGDKWLKTREWVNRLEFSDALMLQAQQRIPFFDAGEFSYLIGHKEHLIRTCAFIIGVNRVIRNNPEKYDAIVRKNITKHDQQQLPNNTRNMFG